MGGHIHRSCIAANMHEVISTASHVCQTAGRAGAGATGVAKGTSTGVGGAGSSGKPVWMTGRPTIGDRFIGELMTTSIRRISVCR